MGVIYDAMTAFPDEKIPDIEWYYDDVISECMDIFSGNPPWKYVKKSGLYALGERKMSMLNAAKVLCDIMSDMTFGSQVDIRISDKSIQKFVLDTLQKNNFWERMPQTLSMGFALGGSVVKVFLLNGEIKLDYLSAESFIPTECESGEISAGIFRMKFRKKGVYYTLLERHGKESDGRISVEFKLFASGNSIDLGHEIPPECIYPGLKSKVIYPYKEKMFSYFHPAVSNNILTDTNIGMSVFYNCIDTLKALDIAFDSLMREFILGRKRIIVPSSCIRTIVDPETGSVRRYFDADDEVYQALKCDDEKDLKIIDNTCELRIEEHTDALSALLSVLCFQAGLSSGTLSFSTSAGVRTAAEIESEENRTARTVNSNRNLAVEFIESIVRSIICAGEMLGKIPTRECDIKISFSKELDVSVDKTIDRNILLEENGIISKNDAKENILDAIS